MSVYIGYLICFCWYWLHLDFEQTEKRQMVQLLSWGRDSWGVDEEIMMRSHTNHLSPYKQVYRWVLRERGKHNISYLVCFGCEGQSKEYSSVETKSDNSEKPSGKKPTSLPKMWLSLSYTISPFQVPIKWLMKCVIYRYTVYLISGRDASKIKALFLKFLR